MVCRKGRIDMRLIVNDVHLGVSRMAGTTPASQIEVKQYLQYSFRSLIMQHLDKTLTINGDLFDGFTIEISEVLECYFTLCDWLTMSTKNVELAAGNHDVGKRNDRLSSFDLLAQLLGSRFGNQVKVIKETTYSDGNVHIIPHMMNQDLFDIELENALTLEPGYLLLHANVNNLFAEEPDHSLNVSEEWLKKLTKLHTVIFAHEHQAKKFKYAGYENGVVVLGNQWPSSVADCLTHGTAQKDGRKYAHILSESGLEAIQTWDRESDFVEMDWTSLEETEARFIRVTGKASGEQASEVISALSKYRQKSKAFVIGNSVAIAGMKGMEDLSTITFEKLVSIDVLGELLKILTPEEGQAIKELLEDEA